MKPVAKAWSYVTAYLYASTAWRLWMRWVYHPLLYISQRPWLDSMDGIECPICMCQDGYIDMHEHYGCTHPSLYDYDDEED